MKGTWFLEVAGSVLRFSSERVSCQSRARGVTSMRRMVLPDRRDTMRFGCWSYMYFCVQYSAIPKVSLLRPQSNRLGVRPSLLSLYMILCFLIQQ
jgi:hypothetical protein